MVRRRGWLFVLGALSCGADDEVGGSGAGTEATAGDDGTAAADDGDGGDDGEDETGPPGDDGDDGDGGDGGSDDDAPLPVCGDGVVEGLEQCDDANRINGDGCDVDCTVNTDTLLWQQTVAGEAGVREAAQGIAVGPDGTIVAVGYIVDVVGDPDIWVRKYDPDGAEIWTQVLDPSLGLEDRGYGVAVDGDGNVILTGEVDVADAMADVWVAKLDPDGGELWSTTFDGPLSGDDGGRGVAVDADGNVALAGFVRAMPNDNDMLLAMLDPDGGELWSHVLAGPATFDDRVQGAAFDPDGNPCFGGYVTNGTFDRDVIVMKYDPAGDEVWTDTWNSMGSTDDAAFAITTASDGSIALTGTTPVIATNEEVWIGRWEADGALSWFKSLGGPAIENDGGWGIAADSEDNFVMVGFKGVGDMDRDIWVRKFDVIGQEVWTQAVAGPALFADEALAVAIDPTDDSIAVAGEIRVTGSSDGDLWVAKFGP